MVYLCLSLKISQEGGRIVIKLPVGKNQWRKLGALKGESRETNKDHTEELSASI